MYPRKPGRKLSFWWGGWPPHQHAFAMYLSMKDRVVSVEPSDASLTPIELSDASNDVGHMPPFLFQSPDKPILAISCIFLSAPQKRWCFGLFFPLCCDRPDKSALLTEWLRSPHPYLNQQKMARRKEEVSPIILQNVWAIFSIFWFEYGVQQ